VGVIPALVRVPTLRLLFPSFTSVVEWAESYLLYLSTFIDWMLCMLFVSKLGVLEENAVEYSIAMVFIIPLLS
jgi:hypothetical protein